MERVFEWDDEKAAANYRKHGVRFEVVRIVSARRADRKERTHYEHG